MLKKLLVCVALLGATFTFATEGVSEMAVSLFGKEEGKTKIEKGAVFVDGLFIPAPYTVSQEGNVILVNGIVASRFKVESKMAAKNASDAAAAAGDEGKDGSDAVSDEEGASIGSEEEPTFTDDGSGAKKGKGASAIEAKLAKKGGGSIESRLAEKKRKAEMAKKSSSGTFNSSALGDDPTALFEEADYTYTPPKRPDPKPVPYIRPGASKSMSERLADAKAREAEAAKAAEAEEEVEEIAVENFDDLSEEEIQEYTAQFKKRREVIEKFLNSDGLVLMASNTSATKLVKGATMRQFIPSLPNLCKGSSAAKLVQRWKKEIPAAHLKKIYNNRSENLNALKPLDARIRKDAKANRK